MNLDTNESVGIGDPVAQTEQAMSNIEMLLRRAGRGSRTSARSSST